MNRSRIPGMLAIAVVSIASAACSERRGGTTSDAPSTIVLGNADGSEVRGLPKSARLEIRPGVKFQRVTTSTTPGATTGTATLNGLPFEILKTGIRIGPKQYGPIAAGDHVVIDFDGVRINGVMNGPLP